MRIRGGWVVGALASLAVLGACLKAGPMQSEEIRVPRPSDAAPWKVHFQLDAADVAVTSGGADLVRGAVTYNVAGLRPVVETSANRVAIRQYARGRLPTDAHNDWRLQVGGGVPLDVDVVAGLSAIEWNLGGASVRDLTWTQGGGHATLAFAAPNAQDMENLTINAGGATLRISGLANAHVKQGQITTGMGAVNLSCEGTLVHDATVVLKAGLAVVTIDSAGNAVQLKTKGPMKVETTRWTRDGDNYCSPECAAGAGPKVTIVAMPGIGLVRLTTGP
jgi:hypothetical protein